MNNIVADANYRKTATEATDHVRAAGFC